MVVCIYTQIHPIQATDKPLRRNCDLCVGGSTGSGTAVKNPKLSTESKFELQKQFYLISCVHDFMETIYLR